MSSILTLGLFFLSFFRMLSLRTLATVLFFAVFLAMAFAEPIPEGESEPESESAASESEPENGVSGLVPAMAAVIFSSVCAAIYA